VKRTPPVPAITIDITIAPTAWANTAALVVGRPGRSWGQAAATTGRQDHGRSHHDARRHLAGTGTGTDHPGPRDRARGATGAWGPLPRSWCNCPRRGNPTRRLPLVALTPQWRQDYLNNRPPTRATAISAGPRAAIRLGSRDARGERERFRLALLHLEALL
jgi:hypothetical protein